MTALAALAWTAGMPLAACRETAPAPPAFDPQVVKALPSWDACGRCHVSVYGEWKDTLHAGAWSDPLYRMSAGNPPKLECRSCHSMEPILARPFSVEHEFRPIYRPYNQEDSVGCVACHLRADGTVAARRAWPGAPCRPVADPRISTPEYCGACHNPTHDAYFEWKSSAYARNGVACSDCHSHPVLREGRRVGYSHRFPGGNDRDFVKRAVRIEPRLDGRELVLSIENLAGHKFPGEVPTRTFLIEIQPFDREGRPTPTIDIGIKRPYKTQVGVPDNRLLPDERRVLRQALPPEAVSVPA